MNKLSKAKLVKERWDQDKRWKPFLLLEDGTVLKLQPKGVLKREVKKDGKGRWVVEWTDFEFGPSGLVKPILRTSRIVKDADTIAEALDIDVCDKGWKR